MLDKTYNEEVSAHSQHRMTPEEYLERERAADFRSEYYQGEVFAMAGASWAHSTLIHNLIYALRNALGKRCSVRSTDLRLQVSARGMYTYPDIMVVCGEPKFIDNRSDTLVNPRVIIEILSASTELYDRGKKAQQYRTVESLEEYVIVSQSTPSVEVFRRQEPGKWLLTEFAGFDAVCKFESLDCEIPLTSIYEDVKFEEQPLSLPSAG